MSCRVISAYPRTRNQARSAIHSSPFQVTNRTWSFNSILLLRTNVPLPKANSIGDKTSRVSSGSWNEYRYDCASKSVHSVISQVRRRNLFEDTLCDRSRDLLFEKQNFLEQNISMNKLFLRFKDVVCTHHTIDYRMCGILS